MNQQSRFDDKGQVHLGPGPSEKSYKDQKTKQGNLLLWEEEQEKLQAWKGANHEEVAS